MSQRCVFLPSHLRYRVGQQAVELLVGTVPDTTPAGRVKVLPDASQADGHPLTEQGMRVRELLQADGYQVPLQTGLLEGGLRRMRKELEGRQGGERVLEGPCQ